MPNANRLQDRIVRLLSNSEAPVLNRALLALLCRDMGRQVDADEYFAAINDLASRKIIGRAPAQGGKVFLIPSTLNGSQQAPLQSAQYWTEPMLMECLGKYLNTTFWRELDFPKAAEWMVIDTSTKGPRAGKWSHPDFAVVSVLPFQVFPTPQLDVYSFELKAELACDLTSVHEALAQTRMTTFGYLVWHLPMASLREVRRPEISEHCVKNGIGLILVRNPNDPLTWEIDSFASRKDTPIAEMDAFLASARLTDEQREKLRTMLSGRDA